VALLFELVSECGGRREDAEVFARHFDDFEWALPDGSAGRCDVRFSRDVDGNWWCFVYPGGVSTSGVVSEGEARRMSELGGLLYGRLMTAPPFRYARVGVEVEEFATISELSSADGKYHLPEHGVVLSQEVWERIGRPPGFTRFNEGHCWRPYNGEMYSRPSRRV